MQLPIGIRDQRGGLEFTRTENIAKGGFSFTSEKVYQVGDKIVALFPDESVTQHLKTPARIVRVQPIEGSNRNIYGAAYDANG